MEVKTWTAISRGTIKDLMDVYFCNADMGFVVGSEGLILKTTNGGITWSSYSGLPNYYLNSVYFTDYQTGYIAGDYGIILKTTNGGLNWTALNSGTYACLDIY